MRPVGRLGALAAVLSALAISGLAQTVIPEPDYVIYGIVSVGGSPIETGAVVQVRRGDDILASYALGFDPDVNPFYVLRIQLEKAVDDANAPPNPAVARAGDVVRFYANRTSANAQETTSSRGVIVRRDLALTALVAPEATPPDRRSL